jgi:L,D-transpeptidase catalytic domain
MKIGSGLMAAAVLLVLAVPPAFARSRHRASLDSQEMRITNSPTTEPIVAPPVTVPESSVYTTPNPRVVAALPPIPTAADNQAASTTPGIDGAEPKGKTAASVDGMQTAAVTPPAAAKDVVGPPDPRMRTPGAMLFDETRDDSALDPNNWAVSVFKKRHELIVYYKGRLFKKYDAVFGRSLDLGAKLWAQDRRTPEGVYSIIEKYRSARFRWFLRLNYPNLVDRVRYETMRVNGVVPVYSDGTSPLVGSAIGIHGTDVPILNAGHINWTTGCISVENKDIDDLDRLLPVGTVVIIKP